MPNKELNERVMDWLKEEGYPLEYYAASAFRAAGLHVRQGMYGESSSNSKPREIDLIAEANFRGNGRFIRIESVIECKWSGNKPVVIFTSRHSQVAKTSCVCSTISNDVCDAALWLIRGNPILENIQLFYTPNNPGIGGRQAFGGVDKFYNSLLSVTSYCASSVKRADRGYEHVRYAHGYGLICLPVVVVEGKIFETRYDETAHQLNIHEVQSSRCHWRGSPDWPLIAHVDVVTRTHLKEFAEKRYADCQILGPALLDVLDRIDIALDKMDDSILSSGAGPTGRSSMPRVLCELVRLKTENEQSISVAKKE